MKAAIIADRSAKSSVANTRTATARGRGDRIEQPEQCLRAADVASKIMNWVIE